MNIFSLKAVNINVRLIELSIESDEILAWKCNCWCLRQCHPISVTSKKSPNVYKSCPRMISLEKWKILTPFQKLSKNVSNLGKIIVATGSKKLPKCHISKIWSHRLCSFFIKIKFAVLNVKTSFAKNEIIRRAKK